MIKVQDWVLEKSYEPANIWDHDKGHTGGYTFDFELKARCYRVIGTEEQIKEELAKDKWVRVDEVYNFEVEPKGGYYYDLYENPEKRNKQVKKDLTEYEEMYKKNKNKLLILRTE